MGREGEGVARPEAIALLAVFLVGMVGAMVSAVKPILVAAYVSALGLGAPSAGTLVGVDMAAFSAGSILVSWRLYRWSRRRVAVGALALIALGNLLSLASGAFTALLLARVIAGLGSGIAAGLTAAALTNMPRAESRFGLYLIMTAGAAALVSSLSGVVLQRFGIDAMFVVLAALVVPALALAHRLPPFHAAAPRAPGRAGASREPRAIATAAVLAGVVVYYLAAGGTWAFIGELGVRHALTPSIVGAALGASLLAGACGALVPFVLRDRIGFAPPIAASVLVTVSSLATLGYTAGVPAYVVGTCAFMFAWLAFFPFVMGLCNRIEPLGRLGALCYGVSAGAQSLGPTVAGLTIDHGGMRTWIACAIAGIVFGSALLLGPALRSGRPRHHAV